MLNSRVIFVLLVVAILIGGTYWKIKSIQRPMVSIPAPAVDDANAVANVWEWQGFIDSDETNNADKENQTYSEQENPADEVVPYDVVRIYNILQTVQINEYGQVVPDHAAKQALDKGFDDLGPDISPEAMAELQKLIRIGLPGEAGEEAAEIMASYYQFRLAEEEFNRQIELDNQVAVIDRYDELVQLRRDFLGDELANQLFAVEDTQTKHLMAAFAIHQNSDLSDEEKQAQQGVLEEKFNDRLLDLGELSPEIAAAEKVQQLRQQGASGSDIYTVRESLLGSARARELAISDREEEQWQAKFSDYWQAHQQVLQAGLTEAESDRQINELLSQYFSPADQERARLTSLEWQIKKSD